MLLNVSTFFRIRQNVFFWKIFAYFMYLQYLCSENPYYAYQNSYVF